MVLLSSLYKLGGGGWSFWRGKSSPKPHSTQGRCLSKFFTVCYNLRVLGSRCQDLMCKTFMGGASMEDKKEQGEREVVGRLQTMLQVSEEGDLGRKSHSCS